MKQRTLLFPILLLWADVAVRAQEEFPSVVAETSAGGTLTLPLSTAEGYTIVAVAFGKKAEPLLEDWYAPAYSRFVAKSGLFASDYHVDLFLMPLFVGANRAAYGTTMNRLRKEVDPEIAQRVVFVKGDARGLIDRLGLADKDVPYFFLLDKQGHIRARVQGAYTVERLEALEAPMLN